MKKEGYIGSIYLPPSVRPSVWLSTNDNASSSKQAPHNIFPKHVAPRSPDSLIKAGVN